MCTSLSRRNECKLFTFYPTFENVHALLMEIQLYVFGQDGSLIESQAVRREKAVIAMSEEELEDAKIVIAPVIEGGQGEPLTLRMANDRYAFVADVELDRDQSSYVLPPVPEDVWRWWLVHSLWNNVQMTTPKKTGLLGW